MRTTVTLDDDVVSALRAMARERRVSFKEALNSSVRAGISQVRAPSAAPFAVTARPMQARPEVDLDKALRLAADLEDDELIRKLTVGK